MVTQAMGSLISSFTSSALIPCSFSVTPHLKIPMTRCSTAMFPKCPSSGFPSPVSTVQPLHTFLDMFDGPDPCSIIHMASRLDERLIQLRRKPWISLLTTKGSLPRGLTNWTTLLIVSFRICIPRNHLSHLHYGDGRKEIDSNGTLRLVLAKAISEIEMVGVIVARSYSHQ